MYRSDTGLHLSRGGRFAAWFASAAPAIAALVGALNVLVVAPGQGLPRAPSSWLLAAVAGACAIALSLTLRRGIRDGRLVPWQLVALAAIPWVVGLALQPVLLLLGWTQFRDAGAASLDVLIGLSAESSYPRMAGAWLAAPLFGSVASALAFACFLWRPPGRRWRGILTALASLAPFSLYVTWAAFQVPGLPGAQLVSMALLGFPFGLALTGAALGDDARTHPHPNWVVAVPAVALVAFLAVASQAVAAAKLESLFAFTAAPGVGADISELAGSQAPALRRFQLIGAALALLPVFLFAWRCHGGELLSAKRPRAWGSSLLLGVALVAADALVANVGVVRPGDAGMINVGQPVPPPSEDSRGTDAPPPPPMVRTRPEPLRLEHDVPAPDEPDALPEADVGRGMEFGATPGEPIAEPVLVSQAELELVQRVDFDIPQGALAPESTTIVVVAVDIDAAGRVTGVRTQRGGSPEVNAAIEQAVRQWVFRPYLSDGRARPVRTVLTVVLRG